jgi:hypothetical protein
MQDKLCPETQACIASGSLHYTPEYRVYVSHRIVMMDFSLCLHHSSDVLCLLYRPCLSNRVQSGVFLCPEW